MVKGSIQVLKPNVTQEQALRTFSRAAFSTLYWRLRAGPLRRIADVYVPYFLFHVECGQTQPRLFAMDAVDGSLDLFEFPRVPGDDQVQSLAGRNSMKVELTLPNAAARLRDKALRIIFQQGFFKLRDVRLEIVPVSCELHMPYWLGFYGHDGSLRCRVMDAVRRRMEGAKASAFFEHWLGA